MVAATKTSTYFVTHQGETRHSYDLEPCREPSVTMLQVVVPDSEALEAIERCTEGTWGIYYIITILVFTLCYKYLS